MNDIEIIFKLFDARFKPILHNSSTLFSDTVQLFMNDFFGKISSEKFIKKYSGILKIPPKILISNPSIFKYILSDTFGIDVTSNLLKQIDGILSKRMDLFFAKYSLDQKYDQLNKAEITKYLKKLNSRHMIYLSKTKTVRKSILEMLSVNSPSKKPIVSNSFSKFDDVQEKTLSKKFSNCDPLLICHYQINSLDNVTLKKLVGYHDFVILDKPLMIFKKIV